MTKVNSRIINSGASIVSMHIESAPKVTVSKKVHHIIGVDKSGSMWGSLDRLGNQLKNNIAKITKSGDLVTVIAFSGRNKCANIGTYRVDTIDELSKFRDNIDRYLKADGMTCFLDPMVEAEKSIDNIDDEYLVNFIFMSDGGNNDAPWNEVMNQVYKVSNKIHNAAVIEYGSYADTKKLQEISEALNGPKIYAKDFDSYAPVFEDLIQGDFGSGKKIEVNIGSFKKDIKYRKEVFYISNSGAVVIVPCANTDTVMLPEYVTEIYAVTKGNLNNGNVSDDALYAVASAYASRAYKYDFIEDILRVLKSGDLLKQLNTAYGKTKLIEFNQDLYKQLVDKNLRKTGDIDINPVNYTLINLINDLRGHARLKINGYNRIGVKRFTDQNSDEQNEMISKAKTAKDFAEISKSLSETQTYGEIDYNQYADITDVVFKMGTCNVSIQVNHDILVTLPTAGRPSGFTDNTYKSKTYRCYTVINDGDINMDSLDIEFKDLDYAKKWSNKSGIALTDDTHTVINVSDLAILSKNRINKLIGTKEDFAKKFVRYKELELQKSMFGKAEKKPKSLTDSNLNEESKNWLMSIGISDSGYYPVGKSKKSDPDNLEAYDVNELNVSIKGMSSKTTKLAKAYIDTLDINKLNKSDIETEFKDLQDEIKETLFAIIVGRRWFKGETLDINDVDSATDSIDINGWTVQIEYRTVINYR